MFLYSALWIKTQALRAKSTATDPQPVASANDQARKRSTVRATAAHTLRTSTITWKRLADLRTMQRQDKREKTRHSRRTHAGAILLLGSRLDSNTRTI